jgi:hypothetical protein
MLLATICAFAIAACGPVDENNGAGNNGGEVTEFDGGRITEDMTWSGTVVVGRSIELNSTLTLEPCTTVEMPLDSTFSVEDGGRLVASGTSDCPITFTSSEPNPSPGSWRRIAIESSAANDQVLEYVTVEYAGQTKENAVRIQETTVSVDNLSVRDSIGDGIRLEEGGLEGGLDNLSFENLTGLVILTDWNNLGQIGAVSASGGERDRIGLKTALEESITMEDKGVPYEIQSGDIRQPLTVEAGVQWLMADGARMFVEDQGSLTINGVEDNPVVIESGIDSPSAGAWDWIEFRGTPNTLTWTEIRHSTKGIWSRSADASITLDNVTFEQNECDWDADNQDAEDGIEFVDTSASKCE